jgi:hypothetical protein
VFASAGSTPAPPAVWVFWRLIWRTESLDRGLILVAGLPLSAIGCAPIAAQPRSCWMHVRNPPLIPNG